MVDLAVSQHAVDRFRERSGVVSSSDPDDCVRYVICALVDNYIGVDGKYYLENNLYAIIRDSVVVTVMAHTGVGGRLVTGLDEGVCLADKSHVYRNGKRTKLVAGKIGKARQAKKTSICRMGRYTIKGLM